MGHHHHHSTIITTASLTRFRLRYQRAEVGSLIKTSLSPLSSTPVSAIVHYHPNNQKASYNWPPLFVCFIDGQYSDHLVCCHCGRILAVTTGSILTLRRVMSRGKRESSRAPSFLCPIGSHAAAHSCGAGGFAHRMSKNPIYTDDHSPDL